MVDTDSSPRISFGKESCGKRKEKEEGGMKMENEVMVYESMALTARDIQSQVNLIQEIMQGVMKSGEHYGVIPGCGDKPALLKPGAEKLNLTFRMAPEFEIETIDMGKGHREYRIKCSLKSIITGKFLGMGVGSASTMETKWRYRNAEPEITDKFVPKEYWEERKKNSVKAQEIIGGKGFVTKKIDGIWKIAKLTGEKVEYDNPADYYNTCLKMAKKRAHVDAVLTVTAASDIFTQDIEEMGEIEVITSKEPQSKPQPETPQEKLTGNEKPSIQDQWKTIFILLNKMEIKDEYEQHQKVSTLLGIDFPITSMKVLTFSQAGKIIELLQKQLKEVK